MDNHAIEDLFSKTAPVSIRRMFGGKGIYVDGRIVALVVDGELMLKADAESAPRFEAAGCRQWTYEAKTKTAAMPYWSIPEEALDDPHEFAPWARLAIEASLRADSVRKPRKKG